MADASPPLLDKSQNKQQFSLRGLLVLVTIMAVNGYLVAPGAKVPVQVLLFVTVALPPMLWMGLLHGTSNQRAFCLGALLPALSTAICASIMMVAATMTNERTEPSPWISMYDQLGLRYPWHLRASLVATNLIGFLCVGLRWLLRRQAREW
jgi:hypothetical protein